MAQKMTLFLRTLFVCSRNFPCAFGNLVNERARARARWLSNSEQSKDVGGKFKVKQLGLAHSLTRPDQ